MVKATISERFAAITDELNAEFLERRAAIEALQLAVLAKQHVFVLGPPGTGKSQLARSFLCRFTGSTYFEALLSKTRPAEALLGPWDIPALRDTGAFVRRIDGYLYTANFAMLDEIGKMSPTTGHDLLAALNERIRHEVNDAGSAHPIPLYTAVTASNELPTGESEDAAALWDRLLVRVAVDYISEPGNFAALIGSAVDATTATHVRTTIGFDELVPVVDDLVPGIPIGSDVVEAVMALKDELRSHGLRPSDRRWRQAMRLVQASAYLGDRIGGANVDDVGVLRYALWETPDQIKTVERAALKIANPLNEESMVIMDSLAGIRSEVTARKGKSLSERAGYGSEAMAKLKQLEREADKLADKCKKAGRSTTRVDEVRDQIVATRRTVLVECLDITDPGQL